LASSAAASWKCTHVRDDLGDDPGDVGQPDLLHAGGHATSSTCMAASATSAVT
jgi:hypothetical protein